MQKIANPPNLSATNFPAIRYIQYAKRQASGIKLNLLSNALK